jgi:hypothetical protein
LNDVTIADHWEKWILFMLDAVEQTAIWTREKIMAIHELIKLLTDDSNDFTRYR